MTYKTILVHCDAGKVVAHRLAIAAELAERFDARLVGLHARPPFETPIYLDAGGAIPMDDLYRAYEETVKANEAVAAAAFKSATAGKAIATEWRAIEGDSVAVLAAHACYADLVVLGQAEPEQTVSPSDLPESVALAVGRPILVVPYIGATTPGKVVMLCWNASREAARAASDALPLLRAAEKVVVLAVDPETSAAGHGADPGADVAVWLAHHDIKVSIRREVASKTDVGSVILSRAADLGADLIVMGVYGHSRLRELVMGGASRELLAGMTLPILMSH